MYSSGGFYLFVISIVTFQVVHKFEYIGYLMYAVGVYFMFTDPQARKLNSESQSYIGDIYAFAGAGCFALFNLINKEGVEELHPLVALTHNFVVGMILQFLIFPFFVDPLVFFSFDPQLGAFGWFMDPNSFVLLIFILSMVIEIV